MESLISNSFVSKKRLLLGPWQAFERILARILQHGGFSDVQLVGGSGDQGADVVAMKGHQRWVIQAKYRNNGAVGRYAVAEAYNALNAYKADVSVTSTNQYFSDDAVKYRTDKVNIGFDLRLWDHNMLEELGIKLPEISKAFRTPRPYQKEAIDAVMASIKSGNNSGLITLATGLGKTMVAASVISEYLEEIPNANILVLAHMSDLVRQLEIACWPQFHKAVDTHVWTDGEKPAFHEGIIFATWQSVDAYISTGNSLENHFDLVIIDEAHHAPSNSFSSLINYLNPKYLLGVTATPWRADGTNLRELFGEPLFSMSVVEGMQKDFLSKVDYEMLTDGINWDHISELSEKGLTIRDLNQLLYIPERDIGLVERVVEEINKIRNPRTLVFCRSIKHAEKLLNYFRGFDLPTAILHSRLGRTERFQALSNFRTGKIKVLISIEMLNEGIDVPEVNLVCFARVTHSRRIFLQQLGRGLRISDDKESVKVLDFVADIRRIAAGIEMNNEARENKATEIVNYPDGNIVSFSSEAEGFFDEYLKDMANISDLDEDSKLTFPRSNYD